jgi:hypothetical protein
MNMEIISRVDKNLTGRFARSKVKRLLEIVELAGDGNYLEIGVLHGGSLCSVALLKKELGHTGTCVGVDMFNGWYGKKDKTDVPVTIEVAQENVNKFGLDNVELIKAKSPNFETDKSFVVSYIDGDHREAGVWDDWLKVKDITTGFVVFHDYKMIAGVTRACNRASLDKDWTVYRKREFVFALRRNDWEITK